MTLHKPVENIQHLIHIYTGHDSHQSQKICKYLSIKHVFSHAVGSSQLWYRLKYLNNYMNFGLDIITDISVPLRMNFNDSDDLLFIQCHKQDKVFTLSSFHQPQL